MARSLPVQALRYNPSAAVSLSDALPAQPRVLRVVHLITDLNVGGAEMMLARLVGASDRTAVENTVISLTADGPLARRIASQDVRVVALGMKPGRMNAAALVRLIRVVRDIKPHVLQTWLYHADLCGLLASSVARVPCLVWNIRCSHLNVSEYSRSLPIILRVLAFASRRPAAVICNSTVGQRVHEQLGYHPKRWVIIPNGVDTDSVKPSPDARKTLRDELNLAPDTPLVGLVARLHPMKDHPTFLRAAALVSKQYPAAHFLAVGRGVAGSDKLKTLVAGLGLGGRVHLQDERHDASRVLAGLDVAVSSSSSGEGFPNTVIEAMASGVPCVVTDVGDSAAIVGDTGAIVPPGDPSALATGVVRLLGSERDALSHLARLRIVSAFSLPQVTARYQLLYQELAQIDSRPCVG